MIVKVIPMHEAEAKVTICHTARRPRLIKLQIK